MHVSSYVFTLWFSYWKDSSNTEDAWSYSKMSPSFKLLEMECSKFSLKSEQFLLTLNNRFSASVSVGRSAPTEAMLIQLCWQGYAACASETNSFVRSCYLQAEVWWCSYLNSTTLKELTVGNTILLKMRNGHLTAWTGRILPCMDTYSNRQIHCLPHIII